MLSKIVLTGLVILLLSTSVAQEVKKQKIEVEKARFTTSQTDIATGVTKSTGSGYKYHWRYVGEEEWKEVDKKFKSIGPIINQYPNSAKLFKQSRVIYKVGKPVSMLFIAGGMIMGGVGL